MHEYIQTQIQRNSVHNMLVFYLEIVLKFGVVHLKFDCESSFKALRKRTRNNNDDVDDADMEK